MFFTIYKTTIKNLVRSPLFWMLFVMFGFVVFELITKGYHGYYDFKLNESIMDTDPRYVLSFVYYVQLVSNTVSGQLLGYTMPLFTSVSVVLILNRDYGDNFYEIEKAAGIKTTHYFFGRLSALLTMNFIVAAVIAFLSLHLYVITRGGVAGFGVWEYIIDSTVRMMRHLIFRVIPALLFYIGFTYCVGSLFRSGIAAALCSIGYVVFVAVTTLMLRHRVDPFYFDYLSPNPKMLRGYLHFYDSDPFQFNTTVEIYNTSLGKAALCVCILVGLALLYTAIAYIRSRKRDR